MILEVEDSGTGIPIQAEPGYGLKNMRDRARLLGAELTINSNIGKGTLVRLDIPMEEIYDCHSPADR